MASGLTKPDDLPFPTFNDDFADFYGDLEDMAVAVQAVLVRDRGTASQAAAAAALAAQNARLVNQGTATGTGNPISVATGHLGIPGCQFDLPAGVGAQVTVHYDLECETYNGTCTALGRLDVYPLSAPVQTLVAGLAPWKPGAAGVRVIISQTWTIPPSAQGMRVLAKIVKDNANAAITCNAQNTRMSYTLSRSGS